MAGIYHRLRNYQNLWNIFKFPVSRWQIYFCGSQDRFCNFLNFFLNFYKTTIFRSLFYKAALPGLSSSSILSLQKELKAKVVLRIRIRIRIPVLLPLSTFINTANYNGITSASQKRKKKSNDYRTKVEIKLFLYPTELPLQSSN